MFITQHYSGYPTYFKPELYPQGRTQKNHFKTSHHSLSFYEPLQWLKVKDSPNVDFLSSNFVTYIPLTLHFIQFTVAKDL